MKKSLILMSIMALFFSGCGNQSSDEHSHDGEHEHTEEKIHKHEDGSVHEDHQEAEHAQEEFKVTTDSASTKTEDHGHNHGEDGHKH